MTAQAKMKGAANAERVLRLTRTFQAPREAVFKAWTERERLMRWWGPKDFTVPVCEMDVRPGGKWRTCMTESDGTEHWVQGVYREIAPPERLVFTWAWETDGVPGHETEIAVEFHERDGGTEIILTQQVFESSESRDGHQKGWSSSFEDLDALLTEG